MYVCRTLLELLYGSCYLMMAYVDIHTKHMWQLAQGRATGKVIYTVSGKRFESHSREHEAVTSLVGNNTQGAGQTAWVEMDDTAGGGGLARASVLVCT